MAAQEANVLEYPSPEFSSLPNALVGAFSASKPLDVYGNLTLAETLIIDQPLYNEWRGHGSMIAGAAMDALVDVRGGRFSDIDGLRLSAPTSTATTALLVRRAGVSSYGLKFRNVRVSGAYSVGIRIGDDGDTAQMDTSRWTQTHVLGVGGVNNTQIGVRVGAGVWANNMAHWFTDLGINNHAINLCVDCLQAGRFQQMMLGGAITQDILFAGTHCQFSGIRSEKSARFLVTSGTGKSGFVNAFDNLLWNAQQMAEDGIWFEYNMSGTLILREVSVLGAAVAPVLKAAPIAPLHIILEGITTEYTPIEFLDVNANVTVTYRNHTQVDANSAIVAQWIDGVQVYPA